jgi:protein phosphatase
MSQIQRAVTRTHIGKVRDRNEDACGAHPAAGILFVADGMGGHPAGHIASRIAAHCADQAVHDFSAGMVDDPFNGLIEAIQQALNAHAQANPATFEMGTTFTAVRKLDDDSIDVLHIGDSRAYLFSRGELRPLTEDHSYVGDLVRTGELTREQARVHPASSMITQVLVADGRQLDSYDRFQPQVEPGSRVLLCTDGLSDMIPEPQIEQLLRENADLEIAADELVAEAMHAGGRDNITLVLAVI